jgi:hypothetical protein
MNEIVDSVAQRMRRSEDFIESHYTIEQVLLKHHFAVREDKRKLDYHATLTANKIAQILAKAFGG